MVPPPANNGCRRSSLSTNWSWPTTSRTNSAWWESWNVTRSFSTNKSPGICFHISILRLSGRLRRFGFRRPLPPYSFTPTAPPFSAASPSSYTDSSIHPSIRTLYYSMPYLSILFYRVRWIHRVTLGSLLCWRLSCSCNTQSKHEEEVERDTHSEAADAAHHDTPRTGCSAGPKKYLVRAAEKKRAKPQRAFRLSVRPRLLSPYPFVANYNNIQSVDLEGELLSSSSSLHYTPCNCRVT